MLNRTPAALLLVLVGYATCFGQTAYGGLTPGRSTRADVERSLGQPVRVVQETLVEYKSQEEGVKLYVQYAGESRAAVVDRIERTCYEKSGSDGLGTCGPGLKSIELLKGVPEDISQQPSSGGQDQPGFVRYYGAPRFIVRTVIGKGVDMVEKLAFYSKELYEDNLPKVGGCTGTIFGKWETERGRVNIVRVGDEIRGTYAKNNGSFTLKQVQGGYMGEWKDGTGSGTMALRLEGAVSDTFNASLSRGAGDAASSKQPPARREIGSKLGSVIDGIAKSGSAVIGPIITESSEPSLRVTGGGLPPGEPLTGKCVP